MCKIGKPLLKHFNKGLLIFQRFPSWISNDLYTDFQSSCLVSKNVFMKGQEGPLPSWQKGLKVALKKFDDICFLFINFCLRSREMY